MNQIVSILLPVYGRSELLEAALESVVNQEKPEWRLFIADDGSDMATQKLISSWMDARQDPRIKWIKRPKNLGLFENLNRAMEETEEEWTLLLCSDDILLPGAIGHIQDCFRKWPESQLILSTFESVDLGGQSRPPDSAEHHDKVSKCSGLVNPEIFIPALLRLGSLNGNLTGMVFSRDLWRQAGPFRGDWKHAADWEWLIRAGEIKPITLNRTPIAKVRTHPKQLSNENRRNGHEVIEVGEVVRILLSHQLLAGQEDRNDWAAHVMQFQLWNVLKSIKANPADNTLRALKAIKNSAGMWDTIYSMVRWLPERWNRRYK